MAKGIRKVLYLDNGYLLLAIKIVCPDAQLVIKNGKPGLLFKRDLKKGGEKGK